MTLTNKIFKIFLSSAFIILSSSCTQKYGYLTITGYAQGGTYQVTLNLTPMVSSAPEDLKAGIDSVLQEIDVTLSGYNKNSLLSRFNAGEEITPNQMFIDIYNLSYSCFKETSGAFDVAAGPLFDIWGFGFKGGEMPDDATVSSTRENCGMGRLLADMNDAARTVTDSVGTRLVLHSSDLLVKDCASGTESGSSDELEADRLPQLNYNAIAQGYSCDLVAAYLYSKGVEDMLINIGGEIFVDGKNPRGKNWTLGVDRPEDGNQESGAKVDVTFSAQNPPCGIVTSGNYRKFYVRDGKKYAHTIDPRTGRPVDHNLLSATVIAPTAADADAYATYCMVIGLEAAAEFILSCPDLEAYLIYEQDGKMITWSSQEQGQNLN